METTDARQMFAFFLPEGTLDYFELVRGRKTAHAIDLVLEEKNAPPLTDGQRGKRVWSKGFQDITVTDFPARGRTVSLTFRRRRWHVEGESELLKREIPLTAPGTQLEQEFAAFLKARG